jgi:HK97 family phage portal protein
MAWNKTEIKAIQQESQKSALGLGAPVSLNPAVAGKGYSDSWDIERAYREGVQKVTWVFRCIDAIAGNQARLPMILRKDNSPSGEVISGKDELLNILNSKSNDGENSFVFRFRLSSQLLMSTRGVFIEKVRSRNGDIAALHLLPPQHTRPIPDARKFVSGYEVLMPTGLKKIVRPEDVIWVRRPHPLDPYLSLTPMETAGVAIEIENLAKIYNRNFLLNDGRPGGLLVIRGEMDEDDKEELRSRFRGNLNRTGQTSVIASDDGVDFVDTSANPRDAAYVEMRKITKEEILAAFGVPESVIGNASGRTFSNAAEELRVFWMETMQPHLEVLARSLDELDADRYVDFDTSSVPILIVAKQERERYLLDEFGSGLISGNEYRAGTGRKTVESELMDSMLANPNLTPIGNTEKPFNTQPTPVDMINAGPPQPPPGLDAGTEPAVPAEPPVPGVPPVEGLPQQAPVAGGVEVPSEPTPAQQAALATNPMEFKSLQDKSEPDEWEVKSAQTVERWTAILDRSLERLFERQQRVVLEKASGAKARRSLESGDLPVDSVFDLAVWNKQMDEDLRPVLAAVVGEAAEYAGPNDGSQELEKQEFSKYLDEQMQRMHKINDTTKEEILAAILVVSIMPTLSPEEKASILRTALGAIFAELLGRRRRVIADMEAGTAFNAGNYLAAVSAQRQSQDQPDRPSVMTFRKQWVAKNDDKVRIDHRILDGQTKTLGEPFEVEGFSLRFPGDPLAPPHLTINCRCKMRWL